MSAKKESLLYGARIEKGVPIVFGTYHQAIQYGMLKTFTRSVKLKGSLNQVVRELLEIYQGSVSDWAVDLLFATSKERERMMPNKYTTEALMLLDRLRESRHRKLFEALIGEFRWADDDVAESARDDELAVLVHVDPEIEPDKHGREKVQVGNEWVIFNQPVSPALRDLIF
ncbi:MAG: hypothetical protein AAB590_00020 [Patescibacteria group bacterium]